MAGRNINLKDGNFVTGGPLAGIARQLNVLARIVGNIRGIDGTVVFQRRNEILIRGGGSAPPFSGNAWIRGKRFTGLDGTPAKKYLQITISTNPATVIEQDGPPPDPWGDNDVWRKKSDISGDLYID